MRLWVYKDTAVEDDLREADPCPWQNPDEAEHCSRIQPGPKETACARLESSTGVVLHTCSEMVGS